VVDKVLAGVRPGGVVACLGLSYKPDVDDFRSSPALEIVDGLTRRYEGEVIASDPWPESLARTQPEIAGRLNICDLATALGRADAVLVLVAHRHYLDPALALAPGQQLIDMTGRIGRGGAR
jgi:UDP-N-acetyl-D-mannosaminuronic acid dehydrogenase